MKSKKSILKITGLAAIVIGGVFFSVKQCLKPECAEMPTSHYSQLGFMQNFSGKGETLLQSENGLNCHEILANGLFRFEYVRYNESYQNYFYDYIFQSNFQSADDVVKAGLSLNLPIEIGIPLGINGRFEKEKHAQWRADYQRTRTQMLSLNIAYESILRYADTSIVNAWSKCKYLEARTNDTGLHLFLLDAGPEEALLTATYDPHGDSDPDATITRVKISGGEMLEKECSPFRIGERIGPGGKATLLKREKNKQLNVNVETNRETRSAQMPAPPELTIRVFTSSETEVEKGNEVEFRWEVAAAKSVRLQGEVVSSSGTKKVKIETSSVFELKATDAEGKTITATRRITVREKPVRLTAVTFTLFVPPTADGKNDDTHIGASLLNSKNVVVANYLNARTDWPIEEGQSYRDVMSIALPDQQDLNREFLRNCIISITKRPKGNDRMTVIIQLGYTFSDGSAIDVSTGAIQMEEQGQQTSSVAIDMPADLKFN